MLYFPSDWVNAPEFIPSSAMLSEVDTQLDFPVMIGELSMLTWSDFNSRTWHDYCLLGVAEQEEAGPSSSSPQSSVKSYAKAVDPNAGQSFKIAQSTSELCPYYFMGSCRYGEECTYIHGDLCELCSQHCLHPTDEAQRLEHNQVIDHDFAIPTRCPINSFLSGLFASAQIGHGEIICRGQIAR